MAEYITPIMNRTSEDVAYARINQNDLENKNIGAWNYTDANRVCNNLKYAAEYMYSQGFLDRPYSMQIKTDWKETDIITYEQLNNMIVNNMNNLKTYSRTDLKWYYITSIVNMDYNIANQLEQNIHALATQEPLPPDTFKLTVVDGLGSGDYEARTKVTIQAVVPEAGMVFDHWSGDHLENIENATASITTYEMPNEDITLRANFTSVIPHKLTVVTHSGTNTYNLSMGITQAIEADPAPEDKVFYEWIVEPSVYERNLFEPAATTNFTMPNEDVTLTAFYITKGKKQLNVRNGNGSGWYEYNTYAAISSKKPSGATFTNWTGDTQYLTGPTTQEYNSIKIPDVNVINIEAHWSIPPVTNVPLTVVNGVITSTGKTEGTFTEGNRVALTANPAPSGYVFDYWSHTGGGYMWGNSAVIGTTASIVTAHYRQLIYSQLTITTASGTTTQTKESKDYFSLNGGTPPSGKIFDKWTGDVSGVYDINSSSTGGYMGTSDRTITATYRDINPHTLTVKQLSGSVTYTQNENTTISITAEDAPTGKRFTGWSVSGAGRVSNSTSKTTTYTFGNGDATLTPNYVNVWTVTVIDGTLGGKTTSVLDEGSWYYNLNCRNLAVYEKWDGWTQEGPGTIYNTASQSTRFQVGAGNVTITANISQYPDKTLTIYFRDPDTGRDSLVSSNTYRYGSYVKITAPVAPDKTTFSTWEGDNLLIRPSALESTAHIDELIQDMTIIATYFYPKSPEYYTLTVYDGYPESGTYATGSQITIRARTPSAGWEFYKWYGDTQYIVNQEGLNLPENSVIIPQKSITLYAKFKVIGELPLYRVSVNNGTASGTYYTDEGETEHNESGVYIDVPAGTEVTLTADDDVVGWVFDYWSGNFEQAGVTDIVTTKTPTIFTMTEYDLNITMNRRELDKYTIYTTNATGAGEYYPGKYAIAGNLRDTDEKHYTFVKWLCVDADGNDCISAIEDPTNISTNVTLTDKSLWVEAVYTTHYKLTVIEGQDTGDGYYYEGETVNSISANTPTPETRLGFDHWEDPVGVCANIYDPTPTVIMKDSVATITAVFTSLDARGNSIIVAGNDLHTGIITRNKSTLINGIYAVGTLVFDRDGCMGVITQVDPDENDDTDDYKAKKLFYGGNF